MTTNFKAFASQTTEEELRLLKNLENIRYTKILKLTTTNVVWAKGNFQLFLTNQWLFHYPEIGLYCPKHWAKMYVLQTQYC